MKLIKINNVYINLGNISKIIHHEMTNMYEIYFNDGTTMRINKNQFQTIKDNI